MYCNHFQVEEDDWNKQVCRLVSKCTLGKVAMAMAGLPRILCPWFLVFLQIFSSQMIEIIPSLGHVSALGSYPKAGFT